MNLEYFIAKKVAASGQQSFSRLIIRIAIVAIALSVTVMISAMATMADRKSTRLNSSHITRSRMPSSA